MRDRDIALTGSSFYILMDMAECRQSWISCRHLSASVRESRRTRI